jgi:halocyanin-like protein
MSNNDNDRDSTADDLQTESRDFLKCIDTEAVIGTPGAGLGDSSPRGKRRKRSCVMNSEETYSRRELLKTGASVGAAGTVTATVTGSASAQDLYGGFLSDVDNFNGETANATGRDEVEVAVGAGNQGLLFDPPAVLVDFGARIHWTWTGAGGAHNVHNVEDPEPLFSSGSPVSDEGAEYSYTFQEGELGVHPYVCQPHEALGMKGVVVVGEQNVEGDLYPFGRTEEDLRLGAIFGGSAMFGLGALIGVAAYRERFGDDTSEY